MRIGVLSDTHGTLDTARELLKAMGPLDLLLHAGDFRRDGEALAREFNLPFKGVVGNCDQGAPGPQEELLEVFPWRILLTHGHTYRVKFGLQRLFYRAQEVEADLVVFGHTHGATHFNEGGIEFLNPGTGGCTRGGTGYSAGVVEVGTGLKTHLFFLTEETQGEGML